MRDLSIHSFWNLKGFQELISPDLPCSGKEKLMFSLLEWHLAASHGISLAQSYQLEVDIPQDPDITLLTLYPKNHALKLLIYSQSTYSSAQTSPFSFFSS